MLLVALGVDVIRSEALEVAHLHRAVDLFAVTFAFTRMLADAAAHGRQRAALFNELVGFFKFAGCNQRNVALRIHPGWASGLARGHALGLGNAIHIGNGLGIGPKHGLACAELAVKFAGQRHRTSNGAIAAGVALAHIDVARALAELHIEIAHVAADALDISQRDDLDVLIARALDQLGRQDAHGAVAGRKGLVQLGHATADGR